MDADFLDYDDLEEDDFGDYGDDIETGDEPGYDDFDASGRILMVAEKNSIAEAIAKALSNTVRTKKNRNVVLYFTAPFQGRRAKFIVTATNGHIFNRDFPKEYQDWSKIDPGELFQAKTVKRPAPRSSAIKILEQQARGCDTLILWLDNDREGENICFEVLDVVTPLMAKGFKVLRAKFSSITVADLRHAFNNGLKSPNKAESLSVDARQVIDLKVGVAFSRFQTLYFSGKYPQLADQMITFGPCQTPTLGFCVQRHEEIKNHVPKTFFMLKLIVSGQSGDREAEWEGERIWNEAEAKKLVASLAGVKQFDVIEATSLEKSKARPEGVNTVQLLKFASSFLGIGPQQTMHLAERLYLRGFISYPRTESTAYPKGFNAVQVIKSLRECGGEIASYASKLLEQGHNQPKSGVDVGDHPPIAPTGTVPAAGSLGGGEKGIYDYISKMFLATHSYDQKYLQNTLRMAYAGQRFKIQGRDVLQEGFAAITPWLAVKADLLNIQKFTTRDNKVIVSSIDYRVGQTQPPDHLTEAELITLMETNGIGTDASMSTHINNISERNYVKVESGARRLVPTQLGLALVATYKKILPDLVAPSLRSNIERQCNLIAKGQADFEDVVKDVIRIFQQKYKEFTQRIHEADFIFGPVANSFEKTVSKKPTHTHNNTLDEPKPFSKCGECSRFMKVFEHQGRVECEQCKKSYHMPKDGKYKIVGDKICPLDKFQIILFESNRQPQVSSYVCPKCFGNSTLIESDQCNCNLCPAQSCAFSFIKRKLGQCNHCGVGDLVLEPYVKGSQFSISCNECWCLYQPIPAVQEVSLGIKKCETCKAKEKQKETDTGHLEQKEYTEVCLLCHPELRSKLLFAKYGDPKKPLEAKPLQKQQHQTQQKSQVISQPKSSGKEGYDRAKDPGVEDEEQQQYRGGRNYGGGHRKGKFQKGGGRQGGWQKDQFGGGEQVTMADFIGNIQQKQSKQRKESDQDPWQVQPQQPQQQQQQQQHQQQQQQQYGRNKQNKQQQQPVKNFQGKKDAELLY